LSLMLEHTSVLLLLNNNLQPLLPQPLHSHQLQLVIILIIDTKEMLKDSCMHQYTLVNKELHS